MINVVKTIENFTKDMLDMSVKINSYIKSLTTYDKMNVKIIDFDTIMLTDTKEKNIVVFSHADVMSVHETVKSLQIQLKNNDHIELK